MPDYFKDENDNYIPDGLEDQFSEIEDKAKEKRDNWKAKIKAFFSDKKNIVISVLSILLIAATFFATKNQPVINEVVKTVKQVPKIGDRYLVVNLDDMKVTKVRETTSRKTNNDLFVVYREDKDQNLFITKFEEIKNLKNNKVEYSRYLEQKTKEAEQLSK